MRILFGLAIAAALTVPAHAQFSFTILQNGQTTNAANGSTIVMNAANAGQSATATVIVTFTGTSGTASFPNPTQIIGSSSFTVSGITATTLNPSESTSFNINYSPASAAQVSAQFQWAFIQQTIVNGVPTTTNSGNIVFILIGTSPNLIVGQITANGTFQTIPNGGTFQFPSTPLNAVASTTLAINNQGSGPGSVSSISVSGAGYQLGGVPLLPVTVNPGAQLNVTIQFQPTAVGAAPGSVQITFGTATYTASISATAVSSLLSYQITQGGTTVPLNPGAPIALGATNVGGVASAILQFQNSGTTAITLNTIAINGAGFTVTNGPFLPITLQPQQSNSLTLSYTPTAPGTSTGRLLIGSDSFPLSGQGLGPSLTYAYSAGGITTAVLPGASIPFSPAANGQTTSIQFTITNSGTTPASLASIGVSPTGVFSVTGLPPFPLQLAPSGTLNFSVNFTPVATGTATAVLTINNQTFGLSGFTAPSPPLPAYSFTGASGQQQPFQQPAIGLSLASPYAYPIVGTLTLTVSATNFATDPNVQFSSGGRVVTFNIPANSLNAVFPGGSNQVQFQTGTVAENIQITPAFFVGSSTGTDITPTNPTAVQFSVPAQAPTLVSASVATQTAGAIAFSVRGYSTTRSLDHLTLQFTAAPDFALVPSFFTVDLTSSAITWYQTAASQAVGGQFNILVPFAFTSTSAPTGTLPSSVFLSMTVTATSSSGTSNQLVVGP
jgi:hypothetical protein